MEWDGVILNDNPELRGGECVAQATGTRGFQREPSVLRAQGENMFAIHVDVANLARVLRNHVRYGAGQERVCRTTPELEVGRRSDPQRAPIDRPCARSPGPEFVEGRLALPEKSEGESGARGPFAEEDFRRLEGLQVKRLRDDRLAHRPDVIELEGHGTPHRLDRDVHVRHLESLVDDVSETLAERSAALGEDEEALRGRGAVPFRQPPSEPVEDRAVRGLRADVVQRSMPGDRLELFQEFVVPPQLPHGVEQRRMSPGPALGEPPQVASTIAWRTSRIAPKQACRLCSARRISSAAIFSMGCAVHTGQRQPLSRTSLARRVPSGKSMRPSRAYFAYEAESKRSHPSRAARGKTSGWPAPNRETGFAGSRPFFDAMITRTRSRNRYASRRGTTPPIAHTATSRDDTDLAQRSRRSAWRPPWTD